MNPLYFIECSYGRIGNSFRELDRDSNSREAVLELIRSGEVEPIKVLLVDESAGTVRDVTDEICSEAQSDLMPDLLSATDLQAARFDHARDIQKNWEPV